MNKKLLSKVSTAVVSLATVVSLSGATALMPAVAHGATVAELAAQIAALQATLAALSGPSSGSAASSALLASGNLTLGSKGAAVMDLQKFLNANGAQVAASGAGSPGNETSTFGSLTKKALAKWQAANGVSPAVGYFGAISRAKMAAAPAAPAPAPVTGGTTPTPAPVVPMGTGLTVTLAPDQPASALAPYNATRIPFTKVQLTASADGAVTVTSLEVERKGLSEDAALAGLVLLNENGIQLGLEKTLNSDHKVVLGETLTVAAGTTRTLTVAARRAASGSRGGQTITLTVTKVNTSAAVNGSFPLTGTTHTVNETLTVGSLVSPTAGPLDPGGSQTKEVGTKNYTFSSVKVTSGSAEKVILKSIRWNQTGSAGSADLANIKTYVDGVAYDTVVSADGKFYTSTFGSGILVDKGFNKEMSIKGDIVGGSARTVDFDVDRRSDLYATGDTYGYGILTADGTNSTGSDDGLFHSTNPWFDAYQVLVSAGTLTVSKWNSVAAQNVAINLADQPMGGWSVDVKGEPVSVGSLVFRLANGPAASGPALTDLDNVKLVDESGKTLAGPVDASGDGTSGTITFTDTITFPIGVTNMKMVGKLGTNFTNNDTVDASTTPSSNWSTVTGQQTGNTITPSPTSGVSGSLMTVKSSALAISVSTVPRAQTVIAGNNQFEFARYILDTSASGEDLRLTSLPLEYNMPGGGTATDLTSCYLFDGSTNLNSSNVKNPSAIASSSSFVFDGNGLILTKGTTKTLSLKCNLKAAATGGYAWGYHTTSSPSPTGVVSGQSVAAADLTENGSVGQTMTAATNGTMTVTLDSSAPYVLSTPGQTVTLADLKYSATLEDVTVKQIALVMSGAASNTPDNLVNQEVTLWDGTTQVGTASFSSGDRATGTVTGFVVPKDGAKVLTVKGKIAGISVSDAMNRSGEFPKVNYDGGGSLTSNYGIGVSSGQTVSPTSGATDSTGVRVVKAYPEFERLSLSDTTLKAQDGLPLARFKVTAKQGDISLGKFTFSVSSSTAAGSNATTSKFSLYVFTDSSFSSPDGDYSGTNNAGGLLNAGNCYSGGSSNSTNSRGGLGNLGAGSTIVEVYPDKSGCNQATNTLKIPASASRWFELRASVGTLAPSGTAENISAQLEGDSAFPVSHQGSSGVGEMGQFGTPAAQLGLEDASNNDFLWSPRSTTTNTGTALLNDNDWTNGYGVSGLPATNMTAQTLSK